MDSYLRINEDKPNSCTCSVKQFFAALIVAAATGAGGYFLGSEITKNQYPSESQISQCIPPGGTTGECPYTQVDDLNGNIMNTASGIPYAKGSRNKDVLENSYVKRVEYESITVDDMQAAVEFYVDILGAVEIDFCSTNNTTNNTADSSCLPDGGVAYYGTAHAQALFSYELGQGENVPNITDDGDFEVHSRFFVLGNGIIQLLRFADRKTGEYYNQREPKTSPCWIGAAHMCLWIDDSLDMNDYIAAAEAAAKEKNLSNVAWNRPVPQKTRQDRNNIPKSQYANKVATGPFEGLEWSYFKGAIGEQLELYKITNVMKNSIGRAYCNRGSVSSAFVDGGNQENTGKSITQQLHGVFQYGYRTDNVHAAVGFYTEVMGGDLITYPTHGTDIRDDSAHWMILANETIEAFELAAESGTTEKQAMNTLGVADIRTNGTMRLDHRFILFDNFVIEPLMYTDGKSFGGQVYSPIWNHSTSPAYIGAVGAAFGVTTDRETATSTLQTGIANLATRAIERGFPEVYFPSKTAASFPPNHPYSGLEYAYGKGQAKEMISLVKISGSFAATIEAALIASGGVSTRFDSTNVYKNGKMEEFCNSV